MDTPHEEALFGRWLRKRRKTLDLTQKLLARQVGCSTATIRKLEADERHPSRQVARQLAAVLGVPEPEREAFIRFARGGWADRPPAAGWSDLERPWRAGAPSMGGEPSIDRPPQQAKLGARPSGDDRADARDDVPSAPSVLARGAELERLDRELEQGLTGKGRSVLVAGEAGQGKTALMTAFAARAQAAHPDLLVAVGTCNAYTGRGDPFLPFRQILAQLTGEVPAGPQVDAYERERTDRLQRFAPRAADVLLGVGPHLLDSLVPAQPLRARLERAGVAASPALVRAAAPADSAFQRTVERGQDALRAETVATLSAIADEAPLVLLLDDLHWLDDSSAELLLHLAQAAPRHPLLLVGAYRPGDLLDSHEDRAPGHTLSELARSQAVRLDLDQADGRAFVEAWLDSEANSLDADFRASLFRQTGGHPLFTIELLRAMQERGDLVQDEAGYWGAAAELHWDELPTRVADALAARIGHLDSAARDILRVASVEGETFTAEVVAAALDREPRGVARILGADLDRAHRLVTELDVRRGPGGFISHYRFRHNLIQRFVYDGIASSERAYLHDSVAVALEGLLGEDADPVALAHHYTLAQSPDRAAIHHRRAGDQARKAGALDRAIEHYQAALASWDQDDIVGRAGVLRDLGECQWNRLALQDARRSLGEALAGFRASGDVRAAGAVQLMISRTHYDDGDWNRALETSREALAMLEEGPDTPELVWAQSEAAGLNMTALNEDEALAWGRRALDTAERVGAEPLRVRALDDFGTMLCLFEPERSEEGLGMLSECFELADRLGLSHEACRAGFNHGGVLRLFNRFGEARVRWEEVLAYARDHQVGLFEVLCRTELWGLAWRQGGWASCLDDRPKLDRLVISEEVETSKPYFVVVLLASAYMDLGLLGKAQSGLQRMASVLGRVVEPQYRCPYLRERLRIAVASGGTEEADAVAQEIAETVRGKRYDETILAPVLTALRWMAGRPSPRLRAGAQECLQGLEEIEGRLRTSEARAAAAQARSAFAAAAGEPEAAATHLLEAAEHWQACGFPLDEARARADAAGALERAGRAADAATELERTRALLAGLAEQIPTADLQESFARVVDAMLTLDGKRLD